MKISSLDIYFILFDNKNFVLIYDDFELYILEIQGKLPYYHDLPNNIIIEKTNNEYTAYIMKKINSNYLY